MMSKCRLRIARKNFDVLVAHLFPGDRGRAWSGSARRHFLKPMEKLHCLSAKSIWRKKALITSMAKSATVP